MRVQVLIAAVLSCLFFSSATSNGLTDAVTWDKYSLSVNGTRVYIRFACLAPISQLGETNSGPVLPSFTTRDSLFRSYG